MSSMCGRMTITTKGYEQLAALLGVDPDPDEAPFYRPRFNVAPTDDHWMVTRVADAGKKKKLRRAKWSFKAGGQKLLINLRSETAGKRFKRMFETRRCLVPADGFYEWHGPKDDRRPIWFHPPDGGLFLFAGLYDEPREGPPVFTVLTTNANSTVASVHDRMPVILSPDKADAWLEAPSAELLAPAPPSALTGTEVSRRVNSVANDDPSCLAPPEPPGRPAQDQMRLF
jgi:putative SOS response-associated peptidase YedK